MADLLSDAVGISVVFVVCWAIACCFSASWFNRKMPVTSAIEAAMPMPQ
ncbi:hypothetical protein [Segatella albensis]|nr:hypothetical protein [Segatella albensis]